MNQLNFDFYNKPYVKPHHYDLDELTHFEDHIDRLMTDFEIYEVEQKLGEE